MGSCMLMNFIGGPHFGGLYVDDLKGGTPIQRQGPPLGRISIDLAGHATFKLQPSCAFPWYGKRSLDGHASFTEALQFQRQILKMIFVLGTIHLRCREIFPTFEPYPQSQEYFNKCLSYKEISNLLTSNNFTLKKLLT